MMPQWRRRGNRANWGIGSLVTHHSFVRFPRTQVPETSRHPRAPDAGHPPPQPSPRLMQRRKSPINRAALRAQLRNHCSPEEPKVERKANTGELVSTGSSVRDSVLTKLKDLFDKGLVENEVYVTGGRGGDQSDTGARRNPLPRRR